MVVKSVVNFELTKAKTNLSEAPQKGRRSMNLEVRSWRWCGRSLRLKTVDCSPHGRGQCRRQHASRP